MSSISSLNYSVQSMSDQSNNCPTSQKWKFDKVPEIFSKRKPQCQDPGKEDKEDTLLTGSQIEVLSLGLSFSPSNGFDLFTAIKDLNLFARKSILKKLHDKSWKYPYFTMLEKIQALNVLEDLQKETPISVSSQKMLFLDPRTLHVYQTCWGYWSS